MATNAFADNSFLDLLITQQGCNSPLALSAHMLHKRVYACSYTSVSFAFICIYLRKITRKKC